MICINGPQLCKHNGLAKLIDTTATNTSSNNNTTSNSIIESTT